MNRRQTTAAHLQATLREEFSGFRLRVRLMTGVVRLLPEGMFPRLRACVYRGFGVRVGRGTVIFAPLEFGWYGDVVRNLKIGERCFFNKSVFIDTTAPVTLGDGISFGHHVTIVTANHETGNERFRAGRVAPKPVTIGNGVWVCAHAIILPGVQIGDGAVIASGAVVSRDVPSHAMVAGVPARIIRFLPGDGDASHASAPGTDGFHAENALPMEAAGLET